MKLEPLLSPKSIAVIGASRKEGKIGHMLLANLLKGGFAGEVVPVNPKAKEILGKPCFARLSDYPNPIDLGVIIVSAKQVQQAAEDCISAGAKVLQVVSSGFRELGAEGAELERELTALCSARGVRLLGPNSLGVINTRHALNATVARQTPLPGGMAVISQSGALCTAILDWASSRQLGISKLISLGNKADLGENDFLAALGEDPDTKVIVGYLENISSGDEFVKVAEAAASVKPVVILKAGITRAGVQAATTHRGGFAGGDIAYAAAFRRSGVIRAETFESLFDIATALAMQPLPAGNRAAIITNAGGPGIIAADVLEQSGLKVATLSTDTASRLRKMLPASAHINNPIDVLGEADPKRYGLAVRAACEDPAVDATIVILTPQALTQPADTAREVARNARGDKPVLASFMGGSDVAPARAELVAAGLPEFPSPERAVVALKAMCDYAAWRRRPPRVVTRFPVNRRRVERIIARQLRAGRVRVAEIKAKEILKAYDFNVPDGFLAQNTSEAVEMAERLGFPVAMKIVSPDIVHKSDVGGVRLSLASPEEVRDAFDLMMLRISRQAPQAAVDGIYIEKMCPRGREVIMGMSRDPQFGPMLMFGLGGIFVEVMEDVTFHLAPITADEAMQMLMGTRSYALLRGADGQSGVDLAGIATGLQRISQLVTDFPQIAELDINPFIVGAVGTEPMVVDAHVTLSDSGGKP